MLKKATIAALPPKGAPERSDAKKAYIATLPYESRLYDDDKVLYDEGRCTDISNACAEQAFAPQDWAMNDSGCTSTKFRTVGTLKDDFDTLCSLGYTDAIHSLTSAGNVRVVRVLNGLAV
jgi:hypothetical protein